MNTSVEFLTILLSKILQGIIPGSLVILYKGKGKDRKYLLTKAVHSDNVTFPSGSISWWENFEKAAIRELMEETGIKVDSLSELPILHNFRYTNLPFNPKSEQHVFVHKLNRYKNIRLYSKETNWFKWANQKEVGRLITHKELRETFKKAIINIKD